MADYPAYMVERAGNLLLDILEDEFRVPYSRFYDGEEELHDWLLGKICKTEEERNLYEYRSVESIIDCAVYQLKEAGIVGTQELNEMLSDGHNDYAIYLTPKGLPLLERRDEIRYFDVYL
ncbi:hypothetical protein HZ994_18065 [Akkermansiaceae bacterium]|nr:hypothetical protein HZ994_18065 [Akkermansiaceae bacterium]